jgi:hypothetical protein
MRIGMVLLVLVLAGCSGSTPQAGPAPLDPVLEAFQAPPVWAVGDHWTVRSLDDNESTRVVSGETALDWIIDTTGEREAFFDAQFDISTIGPQHKSDLSGSQGATRIKFFQWPLTDGASWTTLWDDVERTITAHRQGAVFHFTAMEGDLQRATYTYDPQLKWFGEVTFFDDQGEVDFGLVFSDYRSGFTGEVLRMKVEPYVERNVRAPLVESAQLPAPPAEATDLHASYHVTCAAQGAAGFGVGPAQSAPGIVAPQPSSQGFSASMQCPGAAMDSGVIATAPFQPNWVRAEVLAGTDIQLTYSVLARTWERIPVG